MSEKLIDYQAATAAQKGVMDDLLNRPVGPRTAFDVLMDKDKHDQIARASATFSEAGCIPSHFRGKPKDVFTVLCRAYSWNIDPMMALEQTFVISGKLGIAAQLAIALANNSGKLQGPIDWEVQEKPLKVTAYAKLRDGREIRASVDMAMATAEGWTKNNKYKTMPEHMLMYRSATFLIRRYMPEVLLGMSTTDELQDVQASKAGNGYDYAENSSPGRLNAPEPKDEEPRMLSGDECNELYKMAGNLGVDKESIKAYCKVDSLKDVPGDKYDELYARIIGWGEPITERAIDAATSLEQLDVLQKAMKYYPAGTTTRDKYAAKVRTLGAGAK